MDLYPNPRTDGISSIGRENADCRSPSRSDHTGYWNAEKKMMAREFPWGVPMRCVVSSMVADPMGAVREVLMLFYGLLQPSSDQRKELPRITAQ